MNLPSLSITTSWLHDQFLCVFLLCLAPNETPSLSIALSTDSPSSLNFLSSVTVPAAQIQLLQTV